MLVLKTVSTKITNQLNQLDSRVESGRWNPFHYILWLTKVWGCSSLEHAKTLLYFWAWGLHAASENTCTLRECVCGRRSGAVVIPPNSSFFAGCFFGTVHLPVWAPVYISVPAAAAYVSSEMSTRGFPKFRVNAAMLLPLFKIIPLLFFCRLKCRKTLVSICLTFSCTLTHAVQRPWIFLHLPH